MSIPFDKLNQHYGRLRGEELFEMGNVAVACGMWREGECFDACFAEHWPALFAVTMTTFYGRWDDVPPAQLMRYARRAQRCLATAGARWQDVVGMFWNIGDCRRDAEAHWNILDILRKIIPNNLSQAV